MTGTIEKAESKNNKKKNVKLEEKIAVKICGLRSSQDVELINEASPDFAGVILAEGFHRTITRETATMIRNTLREEIPLVGVFVNDPIEKMLSFVKDGIIDVIQLHGQETEEEILSLRQKTDACIWKVFKITRDTDFDKINSSPADIVLLDGGTGEGKAFDWTFTSKITRPFILAGGLNPENVSKAILSTRPYAVDVSSGVETDGCKNKEKVFDFINTIRHTELHE